MKLTDEHARILRAARDNRLGLNTSGRYIIHGETRPDRKSREQLIYGGLLTWPQAASSGKCRLTRDGWRTLRDFEEAASA